MSEPGESCRYWREEPGQSPEPGHGGPKRSYLSQVSRQLNRREEDVLEKGAGLVEEEHEEGEEHHGAQEAEDNDPPGSHTWAGAEGGVSEGTRINSSLHRGIGTDKKSAGADGSGIIPSGRRKKNLGQTGFVVFFL